MGINEYMKFDKVQETYIILGDLPTNYFLHYKGERD